MLTTSFSKVVMKFRDIGDSIKYLKLVVLVITPNVFQRLQGFETLKGGFENFLYHRNIPQFD